MRCAGSVQHQRSFEGVFCNLQLLERIRYLLEVARPPAAIAPLLAILTRYDSAICPNSQQRTAAGHLPRAVGSERLLSVAMSLFPAQP